MSPGRWPYKSTDLSLELRSTAGHGEKSSGEVSPNPPGGQSLRQDSILS
jgi:hypothetical protein